MGCANCMNSMQQPQSFGKIRNFLWPIYAHEHKKLFPMLTLFFLISFIYNTLKCMKTTLAVNIPGGGAEVIPFLKVLAVLPGAILVTYFYTKLANRLRREQVFYITLTCFISFFTFFLLFLHPHSEQLEFRSLANFLQGILPLGFKGLISMIRHWPSSLFYVMAELWSSVVLSMLFWGFANEITKVEEAKRFYAIFALGANFAPIFSGQIAQLLTVQEYHAFLPFGRTAWDQTLALQLGVMLVLALVIVGLFRWVNVHILAPEQMACVTQTTEAQPKIKLSLKECFAYLMKSKYIMYITILVVVYNIVYNLSDVLWTDQVRQRFPDANDFNAYTNKIVSITGIFATISGLVLSGNVIRRYGWTVTALITPMIWLITSICFFGGLLFESNVVFSDMLYAMFQVPVSSFILMFGSAQICLGRAAKYTVFDETKEIAFIPLSKENQRKGKAVVDGIASRFGKSGGSAILIVLLICGQLSTLIPYIAGIYLFVISLWLIAVKGLGKMVKGVIDVETPPSVETAMPTSVSATSNVSAAG